MGQPDNPVFWSLAIEFQYYLLIGLIFPLLASFPQTHPDAHVVKNLNCNYLDGKQPSDFTAMEGTVDGKDIAPKSVVTYTMRLEPRSPPSCDAAASAGNWFTWPVDCASANGPVRGRLSAAGLRCCAGPDPRSEIEGPRKGSSDEDVCATCQSARNAHVEHKPSKTAGNERNEHG